MDKDFLTLLQKKKQAFYNNPDSIRRKYDMYLESKGIYHSLNRSIFEKKISERYDLCDDILKIYQEAKLENEKLMLLQDLAVIGYDKNKLVELILAVFYSSHQPSNLWEYADLLYSIKNFQYMNEYLAIIRERSYGEARQMLILLVGKSKNKELIPVLKELLDDVTVYGHALDALSNFTGSEIKCIMEKYTTCKETWICKIAKRYLGL